MPRWSNSAARDWRNCVGELALAAVAVLLLLGVARQFRPLDARGELLDQIGLIPQWKFFGQARIGADPAVFDDLHLLVRTDGGEWRELLWWDDRAVIGTVWNSRARSKFFIGQHMMALLSVDDADPTGLSYLTLLRFCLDNAGEEPIQFAIASTGGRGDRSLALRLLSGWHRQ